MKIGALIRIDWWSAIIVLTLALFAVSIILPADSSWRLIATVLFMLLAPGAGLVPLMHLQDTGIEIALVVPVSIAVLILTSVVLFYTNTWTPAREFVTLVGICGVSMGGRVITGIVRPTRQQPEKDPMDANERALQSTTKTIMGGH